MNTPLSGTLLWLVVANLAFAAPRITQQPSPSSNSVSIGVNLSNRVTATTTNPPLAYQWTLNGADLPAATNQTLALTNIQLKDAGGYACRITDQSGPTNSATWVVNVDGTFTKVTAGPIVAGNSSTAGAWGDFNNDGWLDLYVTTYSGPAFLYRNNGDGTFTSITGVPIVAGGLNTFGCAWSDYDNDGFLDLFQGGYNLPSRLFRNNGNGTFSQVTTGAIANVDRGANNVLWGDYDNDGFIDLFVAISFNAPRNVMYHNNGNGTFTKITNSPPVNTPGNSQGAAWGDYDNDGRLDLIVNHTGTRSQLYHNIGGDFIEITNSAVSAVGSEIYAGASWGDYDNDGFLDLFVTSHGYHNALYHNNGDGTFARVTNGPIYQSVGKSTGGAWADYDNDGFLDLFVANDSSTTSFLFHNNGDGTFNQITSGSLVTDIGTGQGACWGDYDNNGFPDLFVPNIFTFNNLLYRNNGNSNAWLTLKLEGRLSNRAAIGAKVRLKADIQGRETWQLREISGGGSLGSQDDLRAAFGLGDAARADLIRIEWPSGIVQELRDVAARQFLTVVEPDARIMPTLLEVQAGEPAEFTVISTLTPPIELQWKLDGVVLPGETNATLSIAHVQPHDAGIYSVAVHQPATGLSFDTRPARLSGPVVITQQPTNTYVRPASNALFRVVATGVNPITCQWRFNREDIIGATNGLLAITNCQMSDAGVYDAVLANSFGSMTSAPAALEILVNPAITLQPLSQSVAVGGSVTFSIAATGSPSPFTFEWRRGSLGLWTNVTSEPMSFLTLTNVQTNQAGNYRVVVKNAANSPPGLISGNAALTVLNDTDSDGLPDQWEIAYGLSATNSADAALDNDGDGMTNAQEYAAGTDPNDASSVLRIDRVACDGTNLWRITFFARSNCTYTVQAREYCGESSVTRNVADVPAAPTNRVVEVTRSAGAVTRQQFFRLVTPRQP